MNEMLKLMHDRRSTRAYRPEPLQEAVIQQILEAGRFAPSGMNKQLNHFYVITDPNYLADTPLWSAARWRTTGTRTSAMEPRCWFW